MRIPFALILFALIQTSACADLSAAEVTSAISNQTPVAGSVTESSPTRLSEVVVSGEQPGPGMWRVEHGDNVLYILGTLSPLPKRMRWKSDEVEALIASAQQVINPTEVKAKSDLGMFRTAMLLPSALRARNNPEEQTLVDVLPADLYQRWLPLKERYMRRNRSVEKRRPIIAASQLYEKAIDKSGLESSSRIDKVIAKAAKRNRVEVVEPMIEITIEDPKAMLKEIAGASLDDIGCFKSTLDRLEIELEHMRARANAWAIGDLEALRELPSQDRGRACIQAITGSAAMQSRGFDKLPERAKQAWLEAVDAALTTHTITFAALPMRQLLGDDGYLQALTARGYVVVAPE